MTAERSMVGLPTVADDSAFETLLEPLLPNAYELAFAMLRDRAAAEDAVQEGAVRHGVRLDAFAISRRSGSGS